MDLGIYNSYLEVDFSKMKESYKKVEAQLEGKCKIIPVVKADGYGQGILRLAEFLVQTMGSDILACAQVYEGATLREGGFKNTEILVMGAAPAHAIAHAVSYDLQTPVFSESGVRMLSDAAKAQCKTAKAQIKIETGMNRIGVTIGEELEKLLAVIKEVGNVEITGVFTHFTNATYTDDDFTRVQFELFKKGVEQVRNAGLNPKYIHCCNTGAISWFKEAFDFCTHVRPGSLYMGYASMDDYTNHLGVSEGTSWRAFITNVHDIQAGESVGYCRHFIADKPMTVATIDVGYADGIYRPMAHDGGPLIVNDTRSRYLATCMDQTIIDVTGIDCKVGDEVTLFGWSKGGALLPLEEIEKFTGQTLSYPLCTVTQRVKRVYIF